ncbi:MAG TPA: hypothetical protein PKU69_00025 [Bacillota bacterium]|nr:hypothetical protein [Bacillota bacterium]
MIQEVIRQYIEDALNANTVALISSPTNNVKFYVGQYIRDEADQSVYKDFIYTIQNGYKTIETSYVPVNIYTSIEYKPLKGTRTGFATCHLQMFVCADDNDTMARIEACNWLGEPNIIVGLSTDLTDSAITYHSVWNMSGLADEGVIAYFNGHKYIILDCEIYIDFSDTCRYGNEYKVEIDGIEIRKLSLKDERECEDDLPHMLGTIEAKGGIKTNAALRSITGYVDDAISAIFDDYEVEFNQDEVHQMTIKTPTNPNGRDFPIQVRSYVLNAELGEKASYTLSYVLSDTLYPSTSPSIIDYSMSRVSDNSWLEITEGQYEQYVADDYTYLETSDIELPDPNDTIYWVIKQFIEGDTYRYWLKDISYIYTVVWKVKNNDHEISEIYSEAGDSTPDLFHDTDLDYNEESEEHSQDISSSLTNPTFIIYAYTLASGKLVSLTINQSVTYSE